MDAEYAETAFDLESAYLEKEDAKRLHKLLHNLDEPYKEVFTLRVFGELPFSQIGELFRKSDSWARLVFYRAKKQLQEAMK
jgi:RNA polymerase sigma-70 factor (ECF subfamily)